MDPRHVELCFGTPHLPPDVDIDDEGSVLDHFVAALGAQDDDPDALVPSTDGVRAATRAMVVRQLLADEPFEPAVEAVDRLLDAGDEPSDVLSQMCAVMLAAVTQSMGSQVQIVDAADEEAALAALLPAHLPLDEMYAGLPLPSAAEIRQATLAAIRRSPGISTSDVRAELAESFGGGDEHDRPVLWFVLDRMSEHLIETGVVSILHPDRLADRASVLADSLTVHRITEADREEPLTIFDADLATITPRADEDTWEESARTFFVDLAAFPVGTLVSIRRTGATWSVEPIDGEFAPYETADPEVVAALRTYYAPSNAESGLPAAVVDLVIDVALAIPGVWSRPHPPLVEILAAAGFEERDGYVALDAETWRNEHRFAIMRRLMRTVHSDDVEGRRLLDTLTEMLGDAEHPARLTRPAVAAFRDPEVGPLLAEALVEEDDLSPETVEMFDAFLANARHDDERALACWLSSLLHERQGRPVEAAELITEAHRLDPTWNPVLERIGWYAFLRGDAAAAMQTWRRLGRSIDREMSFAERFGNPSSSRLGRNDPCWCGSGRKFKACHLGVLETPALDDRVEWLWAKAVGYMLRRGDTAIGDVAELCEARVDDPADEQQLQRAFTDPMVLDIALVSFGWFDRFVEEAGQLLPADERELAASWVSSQRSVYEVVDVAPSGASVLVEVGTGERFELAGPLSKGSVQPGSRWLARLVPTSSGVRPIGGTLRIEEHQIDAVLDVLSDVDAALLCEWMRDPT